MSSEPFSKEKQLGRVPKRPARIKATRQEWEVLREAKLGPCRCKGTKTVCGGRVELHHALPRSQGGGDVASNLVPLCREHHRHIHERCEMCCPRLAASLTDDEYAYCIEKLGEGALERLFGVLSR